MTTEKAREILNGLITENGGLDTIGRNKDIDVDFYLHWEAGSSSATLDGSFTPDELEAIATWIKKEGGA